MPDKMVLLVISGWLRGFNLVLSMRRTVKILSVSGMSLVELMVSVTLLALVSIAAIQLLDMTETTLLGEQSNLNAQRKSEAVAAFVYKDFIEGNLSESSTPQTYVNSAMQEDLKQGSGLAIATLFGNQTRYDGVNVRCALTADANLQAGTFSFRPDCLTIEGIPIAKKMNDLMAKGVVLTTGLEDGVGRCSISEAIVYDLGEGRATVKVDDPACLKWGADPTNGVPAGRQVLFPRFVAYDAERPGMFHTSLIEPPDAAMPGIGLDMPDVEIVQGGGVSNAARFVEALSNNPATEATLQLRTELPQSRLQVVAAPIGVTISGYDTSTVSLTGNVDGIRQALDNLVYFSPDGFFGTDRLSGILQSQSIIRKDSTELDVRANCGCQTKGTAIRFDLGYVNPVTQAFEVTKHITSVSYPGVELPVKFYGYCGPTTEGSLIKFDQADGSYSTHYTDFPSVCARAAHDFTWSDDGFQVLPPPRKPNAPEGQQQPPSPFPYVKNSPVYRDFHRRDRVTVFLYEYVAEYDPPSNPMVQSAGARTNNRYTLFFQFDTFDPTTGKVKFNLNNIQANRNLADLTDPFTFLDDVPEYQPNTIGSNGRMTTSAEWSRANDGAVLPLRIEGEADPMTGLHELKDYVQNADGDANSDPNLQMISWEGLQGWNIRSTNIQACSIEWKNIDFTSQNTGIQLKISESQRCPDVPPSQNGQGDGNGDGDGDGGGEGEGEGEG